MERRGVETRRWEWAASGGIRGSIGGQRGRIAFGWRVSEFAFVEFGAEDGRDNGRRDDYRDEAGADQKINHKKALPSRAGLNAHRRASDRTESTCKKGSGREHGRGIAPRCERDGSLVIRGRARLGECCGTHCTARLPSWGVQWASRKTGSRRSFRGIWQKISLRF